MEVVKEIHSKALAEKKENGDDQEAGAEGSSVIMETSRMPFLMLGLDLPPPPLFKDVMEKNIIPQVGVILLLVSSAQEHTHLTTSSHCLLKVFILCLIQYWIVI